jgi:hypothetical protein
MNEKRYLRVNSEGEPCVDGEYIFFGEYPQSAKSEDVEILEKIDKVQNYYLGSDGKRYALLNVNSSEDVDEGDCGCSNDESIIKGSECYFKVEPLKWRILSITDGKALILSERIIDNISYAYVGGNNNYKKSNVRVWLNKTFYKIAFNSSEKKLIKSTVVDNSSHSTGYEHNKYACANTTDKIFLLSYREIVDYDHVFKDYKSRRKLVTDYAIARDVWVSETYKGNGSWWLRSPDQNMEGYVDLVSSGGYIYGWFAFEESGIAPALVISLE